MSAARALRLTRPVPPESAVLAAVLGALRLHPAVAWAERMNSGAFVVGSGRSRRFVRFGFPGCSDLIGQLRDGRFIAVECKRPGAVPTERQRAFIALVRRNGGIAGIAERVEDALALIAGTPAQ